MKTTKNLFIRLLYFLFFSFIGLLVISVVLGGSSYRGIVAIIVVAFVFFYELFQFIRTTRGYTKANILKAASDMATPKFRYTIISILLIVAVISLILFFVDGPTGPMKYFSVSGIAISFSLAILEYVRIVAIILLLVEILKYAYKILKSPSIPFHGAQYIQSDIQQTGNTMTRAENTNTSVQQESYRLLKITSGITLIIISLIISGKFIVLLLSVFVNSANDKYGAGLLMLPFIIPFIFVGIVTLAIGIFLFISGIRNKK